MRKVLRDLSMVLGLSVASILFLLPRPLALASENMMRLHFIDVGYADALLLELPGGGAVLIDAGSGESAPPLTAYLEGHGVREFTKVILTHPHENHFGGFPSVIGRLKVPAFYTNGDNEHAQEGYASLMALIKDRRIPVTLLREGDEIDLGVEGVRCSVLHPSALDGSTNANALVLCLVFGERSVLLTSDIQPPQQEELLENYPQVASADVVLVPHHGGKLSDTFARAFPETTVFIVSTGPSQYGKPFEEELEKLPGKVLRTDVVGTVLVETDGRQIRISHD